MAAGTARSFKTPLWRPLVGARVLVTGAGGFIGSTLVETLTRLGTQVHGTVRPGGRRQHLPEACEVHEVDLSEVGSPQNLVRALSPDVIFNLACHGTQAGEDDAARSVALNEALPRALLGALEGRAPERWPGLRLVHVGSAAEYGWASGRLEETVEPRPNTLYGKTKYRGTQAVSRAVATGAAAVTARPFVVYGPGQHPSKLLPGLIAAARDDRPIALTSGEQRLDFIYVDDVVEALLRLSVLTGVSPTPVNLGTGELHSVRGFVETAARLLDIPPERLEFGAVPDSRFSFAHAPLSLSRLTALTGWRPSISIEDGIARTLASWAGA